jgi:hypothetical protein
MYVCLNVLKAGQNFYKTHLAQCHICKGKAVSQHTYGGKWGGGVAPTHSRHRH